MTTLFDPLSIGDLHLPNRIVMAPLTRLRAPDGVPNALMAQYYEQRASAGLIITEGTPVRDDGVGYPNVPGIWSEAQTQGWKQITEAVHRAGGRIAAQLWHVGRVSHPLLLQGRQPVAPSAIAPQGHVSLLRPKQPYVEPRELALDEIPGIIDAFRQAARNAKAAGFDGVTIHGANGYLLDQFLQDGSNRRTDAYGGSVENRARLMREVVDAVLEVWDPKRVGLHLAPRSPSYSVTESDPARTFGHVARAMGERGLGFLFIRETAGEGALFAMMKREFGGVCIANDGYDAESAAAVVARGEADAVSFGKAYIANPDLVQRLRLGAPLNALNTDTIYDLETCGPGGYIDYPVLQREAA
ncbi:alkene reductase [Bordetella genomosp. 11]|uniref:Alkene reductase n=1 Tax=Bordetella genomosp. 11 TaxID=1416808 RepID=A0A261UZW6_9BORD|nr:alkene reductase [Bordetella genomosp. 11]OZI67434.1 alkene reductase [Bordetella genomosp. 11]